MKFSMSAALFLVLLVSPTLGTALTKDRTITKVVKLLQSMLEKSKTEGDTERTLFAKYKCYCDGNEATKIEEIDTLANTIEQLKGSIEKLRASTGILSEEVAQLKKDIAENEDEVNTAVNLRKAELTKFQGFSQDMEDSILQLQRAIAALSAIGADQTLGDAADHRKYMANYKGSSLLNLHSSVKQALLAASSFVSKKQQQTIDSFLQAPFTATYTAQSGEVIGILKEMKDTFSANLASAVAQEKAADEAHTKYLKSMSDAHSSMTKSLNKKQQQVGDNDGELALKTGQLSNAETSTSDAEDFVAKLKTMCSDKSKEYDQRVLLRTNEQAAIAEAISILNSDAAFDTFGTVTATREGATGFLQMRAVRRHAAAAKVAPREQAQALLRKAAATHQSPMLSKVAAMLQANNPFAVVLKEIKKMIALIDDEEKADDEQLAWCKSERTTNNKNLLEKKSQITTLNQEIDTLNFDIDDPEQGLKAMIQEDETALTENIESQGDETKTRTEANLDYQKNIANLVEAETLLEKAIKVLNAYYNKILEKDASLAQMKEDPQTSSPWKEGGYKGQSESGTSAIQMLDFILGETKKEETAAHDSERTDQHKYEDRMATLKKDQGDLQDTIAAQKLRLAEKEKELLGKHKDLKATETDKAAIEAYLEKIKDGCDFITANIADRKSNRDTEKKALENAVTLIRGTPAYLTYVDESHNESLGDCLSICTGNEDHVDCKACLAKVTVPGYCAGHPGTVGC